MSSPAVSQEAVYQCTGNPLPSDIEQCFRWLMNETIAEGYSSAASCVTLHHGRLQASCLS